ncbi:unnamed protein product [Urochloa decumbens]|uniref:Disease resistance N-terminal domain-containing protein n=1 Tax=Urochloa decumbens TaxID=240449 RepID=A0ABC9D629_9POAL
MDDHKQERKEDDSRWTLAMVSSSMGAINSLLKKLPAEPDLTELSLDCIQQHLLGFCARGVVVTDRLDRQWMKLLRELAYDIEDWIDKLRIQDGCQSKLESDCSNLLQEFESDCSDVLQEFKERILSLQDLGQQFGLLKVGFADLVPSTLDLEDTTPEKIMHDDGILCQKKPCIVGLSDQEREIVRRLIDDEKQHKVVSILGP